MKTSLSVWKRDQTKKVSKQQRSLRVLYRRYNSFQAAFDSRFALMRLVCNLKIRFFQFSVVYGSDKIPGHNNNNEKVVLNTCVTAHASNNCVCWMLRYAQIGLKCPLSRALEHIARSNLHKCQLSRALELVWSFDCRIGSTSFVT